jgi:hypothetical protein
VWEKHTVFNINGCGTNMDIKMDVQEVGCGAWTGLIWLRIGTGGGLL